MNTFSKLFVQIVFATKGRESFIKPEWEERLYRYITGILQNKGQKLLAINGMPDHIHIFIGMSTDCTISELVREVKKCSNAFVKDNRFCNARFSWQEGYGAFSYSESDIDSVVKYIMNQKDHHKKIKFRDEYVDLLKENGINFNEKYLFTWYD